MNRLNARDGMPNTAKFHSLTFLHCATLGTTQSEQHRKRNNMNAENTEIWTTTRTY